MPARSAATAYGPSAALAFAMRRAASCLASALGSPVKQIVTGDVHRSFLPISRNELFLFFKNGGREVFFSARETSEDGHDGKRNDDAGP